MEKNKNRTDLLAAGRKKLQQYRQKKDGKGSKPSGKAAKASNDSTSNSDSAANKQPEMNIKAPELDRSVSDISKGLAEVLALQSREESEASDADVSTSTSPRLPSIPETSLAEAALTAISELPLEDSVGGESEQQHDSSASNNDGAASTVNTSMERNSSSESVETLNVDMPVSVDLSGPPDLSTSSAIEVDCVHGEDQVPDVGAEQEAESSSYKQSEVEEEKRPDLYQLDENAEALEETSLGNSVSVLSGIPAETRIDWKEDEDDPALSQSVVVSDETSSINPELLIQKQEDVIGASSDSGGLHSENVEADMSGQTVHVEERSPESKVGHVEDMSSISLAQVAEVVKGLGEDEFQFLLTARESAIQDRPLSDVWAKVEEQLYLSNLEKNVFQLQLSEELGLKEDFDCQRNKLVNEISKLTVSLDESIGKNSSLSLEKDDLQKQFHFAKAECEELSARADALLFKLESSQKELTECKDVVAALRTENENLDESLTSMTEERRKVEEAKEMFLLENEKLVAELRECKASLHLFEEEKKDVFSNNDKLLTDLADCKKLSETLQLENENLNNILASVREGREKLDEEREELATELREYRALLDLLKEEKEEYIKNNDKLLTDLAASTDLANTLQVENGNLNDILIKLRESKEKVDEEKEKLSIDLRECRALLDLLEEEKKAYISKNDKLLTDLADSTDLAKALQVENENLNSTVTLLRESREMGDEEKEKLSTELRECRTLLDLLEEEKKAHVSYNDKLLSDLTGSKKLAEALQLENETLHNVLTSLKEGKEKLDEELMGSKHLVESLEKEIVNLSGSLALEKEGRVKLQEEKDFFAKESEKLLTEVADLKGGMDDLKEATLKVEQLTEENNFLSNNLNLYKANVQESDNMQQSSRSVEASDSVEDSRDGVKSDEHGENANEADVELVVLYEFMKQHVQEVEAKKGELSGLYEALMQKKKDLELQLTESRSRVDELERQFNLLHQSSKERESVLEEERSSTVALIVKEVEKLDACIGAEGPTDTAGEASHVAASIDAATRLIKNLQEKVEVACRDHDSRGNEIDELKKRCIGKDFILKLIEDIESVVKLEGSELNVDEAMSCVESLIYFLLQKYKEADEDLGMKETSMLELQGQNDQLNLSIIQHENEILVLKESLRTALEDLEAVRSNVQENVAKLEQSEESSLDLKRQKDHLSLLIVQHENEILSLKESLKMAMDDLAAVRSNVQEKAAELEQSEHRVSSLREKLGIAVTKGKGLIVQRDSLKNSLAETSNELERCLQELQLKDSILHDLETKLKNYSEAGERVEALESELSYIRNSATALRESFFLKDSMLQRIEEILEDLEMPENILARDIIEKVEWLVRKVPEGSTGGGSYSDSGFVVMDAWKEESQQTSNSGEDLKRKNEDLQSKFYELAEQNEMLEQSLKERNKIVQRWEEVLDKLNMPAQFRSMEPEDRIEWLGGAFSEAIHHCNSLEEKVHNSDRFCESLTADLEESERRILDLEAALHSVNTEKEHLSKSLDILSSDYDKVLEKAQFFDGENDKLQNEATGLQENLEDSQRKISDLEAENSKLQDEITDLQQKIDERIGVDEHLQHVEGEIRKFKSLVSDALQVDSNTDNLVLGTSGTEGLEVLLKKLVEKSTNLPPGGFVPRHAEKSTEKTEETAIMKKELEEASADLTRLKEEKEKLMEENQSLVREVERLDTKRQELQELLNQEEQKSASVREKLNLAVRKGKSLVQQRDGMRQTIDEVTSEVERLKSEIKLKEIALLEYHKRMEAVESERLSFRNRLAETESELQEKGHTLSMILHALGEIDIGSEFRGVDPVEKIVKIRGRFDDLHVAVDSSENDARKSKRAAELLLAELNEVQERNDGLQEELANAASEISELRKQIYSVEADRHEREKEIVELRAVESGVDELKKGFFDMKSILGDVLSKDLEFLHNLEAGMMSSLRSSDDAPNLVSLSPTGSVVPSSETKVNLPFLKSFSDSKIQEHSKYTRVSEISSSLGQTIQNIMKEIGVFKETLHNHSLSVQGETDVLSEILASFHHEITSRKNSYESMKRDIIRLESIAREKDTDNNVMRRSVSLLYEACKNSVTELGNLKSQLLGDGQLRFSVWSVTPLDGDNLFSVQPLSSSEEYVRVMADSLLSAVNDVVSTQPEVLEASQKEMKSTISNLQKELQEKDIQKDRICVELVGQIKAAEATATGYMQELQPSKARIVDLEKRVNELQDRESALEDLKKKERSLTDALAAKEQEIEALMQALDEEEGQMEEMRSKIEELESVVQQKNTELQTAEASRSKATKKLSVTVNKFDELHNLSANLLSEVEKLQSQLQERDSEISFLRQEVTRCTNDALVSSQMNSKRDSDGINDMVTWLGSLVSQLQLVPDLNADSEKGNLVQEYKEILQKKIVSIVSELEDLRANVQNRDELLQEERSRRESLENSLRVKESQLTMLQGDPGQSEIVEVEPVINKWTVPAATSVAPQVRSLRKLNNNDQVAIAIDTEPDSNTSLLEDEDDDKAHGFKHLTTSKIVPRFTRPVSNVIDGLWVSCDRALMRQPALRLGVIIYWVVVHALLAAFVV